MAMDEPVSVKDTVYKLQLSLLEGIKNEDQLFAAGSVMSRGDYEDVVTERSIVNLCGYPLCSNPLPSDRPHKGRYRISLKEHKVYDLNVTYMFCSSSCVINSQAFAGSLQDERCSALDPVKLNKVLQLFEDLSLDGDSLEKNGDLGFSNLKIQENTEIKGGEVSLDQWLGPSHAIEGYVPQRDRGSEPSLTSIKDQEGSKANQGKSGTGNKFSFNDIDFMSTIITNDEYSISKTSLDMSNVTSEVKVKKQKAKGTVKALQKGKGHGKDSKSSTSAEHGSCKVRRNSIEEKRVTIKDEVRCKDLTSPSSSSQTSSSRHMQQTEEKCREGNESKLSERNLRPSLKTSQGKKLGRSVTWADEKVDSAGKGDLCEYREMEDSDAAAGDDNNFSRIESAEACAAALSQAAEAVASGEADVEDAMLGAGVILLPPSRDLGEGDSPEDPDMLAPESSLKWPGKPGIPESEYFDPEDLWYDAPPEGFSFTLSPFAKMWMALFSWVTSSSLAYIYGNDGNADEDYSSVNGREYPQKIVLQDGRSSEIKQTVEGCLARASPGLVTDLRVRIPLSTLEQGMARLLETMSFVDALPAFRIKQWQVIALLFIEALSVCRIPALASDMTNRRMAFHRVVEGAHISAEEYELMKDLLMPLGRAPQFFAQSGA